MLVSPWGWRQTCVLMLGLSEFSAYQQVRVVHSSSRRLSQDTVVTAFLNFRAWNFTLHHRTCLFTILDTVIPRQQMQKLGRSLLKTSPCNWAQYCLPGRTQNATVGNNFTITRRTGTPQGCLLSPKPAQHKIALLPLSNTGWFLLLLVLGPELYFLYIYIFNLCIGYMLCGETNGNDNTELNY